MIANASEGLANYINAIIRDQQDMKLGVFYDPVSAGCKLGGMSSVLGLPIGASDQITARVKEWMASGRETYTVEEMVSDIPL